MKRSVLVFVASVLLIVSGCTGCNTTPPLVVPKPPANEKQKEGTIGLSQDEIQALRSKNNVLLTDQLKQRLLANKNELKLTPEEMQVLKRTGKVILCGKCGYLLSERKYKEFERGKVINLDKKTGFAPDSLRERIIKLDIED